MTLRTPRRTMDAHLVAVARTLSWAEESASHGDYADALAWLDVLAAIREPLPDEYVDKRRAWRRALAERQAARDPIRPAA
jgi:hypothetical protein